MTPLEKPETALRHVVHARRSSPLFRCEDDGGGGVESLDEDPLDDPSL